MQCTTFKSIFDSLTNVKFSRLKDLIPTEKDAYSLFHKNLLFLKILTLIIGIILVILNLTKYKNLGLVQTDLIRFIRESIIFGLSGALPFTLLAILRNKKMCKRNIWFITFSLFVIFFIINFILELSGFYDFVFKKNNYKISRNINTKNPRQQFINDLSFTGLICIIMLFIIPILTIIFCAIIIRNVNVQYNFNINKIILFIIETILFGVLSAFPIFLISKDHGDKDHKATTIEFFIVVAKFSIFNIVLQLCGFYDKVFY